MKTFFYEITNLQEKYLQNTELLHSPRYLSNPSKSLGTSFINHENQCSLFSFGVCYLHTENFRRSYRTRETFTQNTPTQHILSTPLSSIARRLYQKDVRVVREGMQENVILHSLSLSSISHRNSFGPKGQNEG